MLRITKRFYLSAGIIVPALVTVMLFSVVAFFVTIPFIKEVLMNSKYKIVQSEVATALSVVNGYYLLECSGKMNRQEAQGAAKEILRMMRYGNNEYFFIVDYDYISIMHPQRKNFDGAPMEKIQDSEGKYFIKELVNIAKREKSGFLRYRWYEKSNDQKNRIPKVAFVQAFEPWQWVIGSGVYIGDATKEIKHSVGTTIAINGAIIGISLLLSLVIILQSIKTIKKQLAAQNALAAEKERLAVTLRSISDGVITTDTQGNVVIVNNVAEILTGWSQKEAIGKPLAAIFNIVNELTRIPCENPVEMALLSGSTVEPANHTLLIDRNGTERIIADSGAPIKDESGRTIGVVLVFRDMTEKQKLIQASQKNQKLDSLGVLAGGIAHDFNNFLTGILGFIELAHYESKDSQVSEYLSNALSSVSRARNLTLQLLTFAKGGAPNKKIGLLFPFVEKVMQFALSGSNCSCRFTIAQNLRACNFDPDQIGQVIDNITINAMQAMPSGGIIEVTIKNCILKGKEHLTLAKGNYILLSIKDSGHGIPKEIIGRIFDPFFTTKIKGSGLGLSISYSIINRHNGVIDVDSQPGSGATFHIYLPASEESFSASSSEPGINHHGHGKIIIMDDDESIRLIFEALLRSMGYTVICTKDGKEALDFFTEEHRANRPVVAIFLDLTVQGGMGGKEAVAKIRALAPHIPVFVASGYVAEDPVIAHPTDYGFTASICKPFMRTEVMELLEKHLPKKG
jgi:PAS domain S-box-containing protein